MSIVVSRTLPNCASNGTILINSLGKREVVNSAYLHSFPPLNILVMRLRETMPRYSNILQTDTGYYCRTNCQLKYLRKDIANGVSKKGTLLVNIEHRTSQSIYQQLQSLVSDITRCYWKWTHSLSIHYPGWVSADVT